MPPTATNVYKVPATYSAYNGTSSRSVSPPSAAYPGEYHNGTFGTPKTTARTLPSATPVMQQEAALPEATTPVPKKKKEVVPKAPSHISPASKVVSNSSPVSNLSLPDLKPFHSHYAPNLCHEYAAWIPSMILNGIPVTPEFSQVCEAAIGSVSRNFPGSMPDRQVVATLLKAMEKKCPNFSAETCLLGTSFCPDEISNEKGDLPQLLYEKFGKGFQFSGLGGMPFAGKTGFKAFAAHVPENGNFLIVYGPHVAISPDGTVGMFKRPGQKHLTTACGACIGALGTVESGQPLPTPGTDEYNMDFQMNYITKEIKKRIDAIQSHPGGKHVGLPYESFSVAQELMQNIIDLDCLGGGVVCLLGGIQINMPDPLPDFYLPLCFKKYQKGVEPESLIQLLSDKELFC